jgi:uncharacterized SAM-binding protein YcdF (DUF218 family)
VVLAVVYVVTTYAQVRTTASADDPRASDAIVVMGAAQWDGRPSPVLAARLDQAVALYDRGVAPFVVVTGGKQPADRFTEAGVAREYLEEQGVPAAAILSEDRGRTSWESLQAVDVLLGERALTSVVLVSDPYHSLRIRSMARSLGLDAVTSPTRTSPEPDVGRHEFGETAAVALGRIIGWERVDRLAG